MIKHLLPLLLIIATLRAETPTLALLAADDAARAAGELLIATRGGEGMVWVEREQREALLKERSIFLHRTRADGQDFDLRRWVEADILLVVETFEAEQSQLWLRALDVVTGVRLAEELLRSDIQRPDAGAAALDTLLRDQVIPAWKQLWREGERFHGITLLDITLVDATDPERRALAPVAELVQRMVVRHPDLILMERELLETLLREESLSPALRLKLRSGGVLLRGILHREAEGPVFTLQGLSTGRDTLFEKRIPLTERDQAVDLAERILRELLAEVEGREPASRSDLRGESARFHQLARYYRSRSDTARALEAARRAWALDPRNARNRSLYYDLLYENLNGRRGQVSRTNVEEIEAFFRELGFLMDLLPMDERSRSDFKPDGMVSQTERYFTRALENNDSLRDKWAETLAGYKRSVHYCTDFRVLDWFPIGSSAFTEEERDAVFQYHADFHIPVDYRALGNIFGRLLMRGPTADPVVYMNPLPLETALSLAEQARQRPIYAMRSQRDDQAYPFLKNMILSSLYISAARHEEAYGENARTHMRQMALHLILDPLLWTSYREGINLTYDPDYLSMLREVFVETREWLEALGWFLPEFYFLDNREQFEFVSRMAVESPLNMISLFEKKDLSQGRGEEFFMRSRGWRVIGTTISVRPENLSVQDVIQPSTLLQAENRIRDSRVFGDHLAVLQGVNASDGNSSLALHVYREQNGRKQRQRTFRFPNRPGALRIDPHRPKFFFNLLLGGQDHLYLTHQHSLYRFDVGLENMKTLHLEDWGFPEHMVSGVLETDEGIWVALTKQYHLRQEGILKREIAGGVLVLADRDLNLRSIVSNVERPEPENDLDRVGPFCITSMTMEPDGSILLTHDFLNHVYFRIGPDYVPRRVEALRRNAFFSRWEQMLAEIGSWSGEDSLEEFYEKASHNFILQDPVFFPFLLRYSHSTSHLNVLRSGSDTLFLGRAGFRSEFRTEPGVFAMFERDGRMVTVPLWSDPRDDLRSLARWGDSLVLTTRDKILLIPFGSWRKSAKVEGISYPVLEHLSDAYFEALGELRKEVRSRIDPLPPIPVDIPKSEPFHAMVPLPAGRFTRVAGDGKVGTVEVEAFQMSDTQITRREFFRVHRWAVQNGYVFSTSVYQPMRPRNEPDLPATFGSHDAFLYCNALSEMQGRQSAYTLDPKHTHVFRSVFEIPGQSVSRLNVYVNSRSGYRLPTEDEWEYVARNADPEHRYRFPWGDHISHKLANYAATGWESFDQSVGGVHPDFANLRPPIALAKSFPPHGYQNRFYGLIGNLADLVMARPDHRSGTDELILNDFRLTGGGWDQNAGNSVVGVTREWHSTSYRSFRVVLPGNAEGLENQQDLEKETP